MLCAWCRVISQVLPPFLHVCRIAVFQWVLLRMQVPLMVLAHLFFFHLSLVLNPKTRNLLCALCLLALLRLTRMFLVFLCQALRHVCRVPMSAMFPVLPTSVGLKLGASGIRAIRRNRPTFGGLVPPPLLVRPLWSLGLTLMASVRVCSAGIFIKGAAI